MNCDKSCINASPVNINIPALFQFSSDLLQNNVDLRTIEELMGHKSSSMTTGYARSNDQLKTNAIHSRPTLDTNKVLSLMNNA